MAQIFDFNDSSLSRAVSALTAGVPIVFPTETVYGIGANAYSDAAVCEIFARKNRPVFNPLIIHYKSIESVWNDVQQTELALALAERFWPGPLTIVMKKRQNSLISMLATAGLQTVAVRVPSHHVANHILKALPFPLAAPSANISSTLSPTKAEVAQENFLQYKDMVIINGDQCSVGIESTIVDITSNNIDLLRFGAITADQLSQIGNVTIKSTINQKNPKCPGSLLKHYSPKHNLKINVDQCCEYDSLLSIGNSIDCNCVAELNLSPNMDLSQAAANLFWMLHELDKSECQNICVMPVPNHGIGAAINDRLTRAASKIN